MGTQPTEAELESSMWTSIGLGGVQGAPCPVHGVPSCCSQTTLGMAKSFIFWDPQSAMGPEQT